jgi:hypothetical protein
VAAGRDPAQAEVTVLDIPVIGRDREDAASIVENCAAGLTPPPSPSATTPALPTSTSAATGCWPTAA